MMIFLGSMIEKRKLKDSHTYRYMMRSGLYTAEQIQAFSKSAGYRLDLMHLMIDDLEKRPWYWHIYNIVCFGKPGEKEVDNYVESVMQYVQKSE